MPHFANRNFFKKTTGVYAFKCSEAEELFNVVKLATENSCNVPEIGLIDQINSQPLPPFIDCLANSPSNNPLNPSNQANDGQSSPTSQVIQFNQQNTNLNTNLNTDLNAHRDASVNSNLNTINRLSRLNNESSPPKLPASHFYANDIRQYMNVFDNGYVNKDSSPLLNQDFDFSETVNLNYAKLDDLQLQLSNLNNNNQRPVVCAAGQTPHPSRDVVDYRNIQLCQSTQLLGNDTDHVLMKALKLARKNFVSNDLEHQLNYTTLALDEAEPGVISTPVKPARKNGDFRPNSEPTSPSYKKDIKQQYSTIDFTKTKALNLVKMPKMNRPKNGFTKC